MDSSTKDFWLDIWQKNQTRFHQENFNRHLTKFITDLKLAKKTKTLVPLCGKTLDLLFLKSLDLDITGIEISHLAIKQFFLENNLKIERQHNNIYQYDENLKIICTDFFSYQNNQKFSFVYDRASLIALSKEDRKKYVNVLKSILEKNAKILIIILEYTSTKDIAPPYSVSTNDFYELFSSDFTIKLLCEKKIEQKNIKIKEINTMTERVYLLKFNQ